MSRVGKQPVQLAQGVQVVCSSEEVQVTGPKGKLALKVKPGIKILQDGNKLIVSADNIADKEKKSQFGTTRALLNNMVKGVTTGWKRVLEMSGVGFNAKVQGQTIVLSVGFSHDVTLAIPVGVTCAVQKNQIELLSHDKELVGTFAALIRSIQQPEPYLGKGIKYAEEVVRRKAGKTGKK